MAAIYDYQGVVEKVMEKQTFPSGFVKQDVVITDDVDAMTKYPNHLLFTCKKDGCNYLNNVKQGDRVKVHFAIDGRAWQDPKSGNTRYFTDLTVLKLESLTEGGNAVVPEAAAPEDVPSDVSADPDNLPF